MNPEDAWNRVVQHELLPVAQTCFETALGVKPTHERLVFPGGTPEDRHLDAIAILTLALETAEDSRAGLPEGRRARMRLVPPPKDDDGDPGRG